MCTLTGTCGHLPPRPTTLVAITAQPRPGLMIIKTTAHLVYVLLGSYSPSRNVIELHTFCLLDKIGLTYKEEEMR